MTETNDTSNVKKSLAFLKTLYADAHVNLVAIDPHSENITGITRPVGHLDVERFIEKNNGKRNLYFMVNSPRPDAPDTKLKKEHVAFINAVWLDADPEKDKPFDKERERLLQFARDLAGSENAPTVITDSGGGVQAFWFLDQPIAVTDEIRQHYESLSRGLADEYHTDRVHNIDRIMRLPYTWNIPTRKKKDRVKTLARSSRIGSRYVASSLTNFIEPVTADETDNAIDYSVLDMVEARKPLTPEVIEKFKKARKRNQKIDDLWTNKIDMKPSRSERDFSLAKELKSEGFNLLETAQIMMRFEHGKGKALTQREIIRCYERSGNDFVDSLSEEQITAIEKQVNPIKAAKEETKKLISGAKFITLGEATETGSGTPLFKHLLNTETVNVLFGPSGSGKSFLTLDMAVHLAAGKHWGGYRCKKKMAVLYVCTESGSSFGKRAKAARGRIGLKANCSLKDVPFAYYPAHVDLLNNKDHAKLIEKLVDDLEAASGHKCGMVVIDTLSAAFGGGNENSEDMTKFVNNMAALKYGKKVAVLVVHHTGKDESAGARGHSSLKGNVDTEIQVRSEKKGDKYHRSFSSTKQKDDETGNMRRFGLTIVELGTDEDGDAITTCSVVLEGDDGFDLVVPSVEDELDSEAVCALEAIRYYDEAIRKKDHHFTHTEREAKAVIFNAMVKATGIFDPQVKSLSPLNVMSRPKQNDSVLKSFGRACEKLLEKNLVRANCKFQLSDDE